MKKLFTLLLVSLSLNLYAQSSNEMEGPKEIENKISAVKNANPGDYILLPSGKRYILTKEEIAIVKGDFNYDDLSNVETTIEEDGTEVKTISQAHIVYVFPDGQSTHVLKASFSFTAYMRHIKKTFYLAHYIDWYETPNDYLNIAPPEFDVFRAKVQYQMISDGFEEMQSITIMAYNYDSQNMMIRYTSKPDMIWGHIDERGSYKPVGETREIEFDVE